MLVSITIQVGLLCVQKQTGQQCSLQFTCWVMRKAVLLQPKQPGFFIESCSTDGNDKRCYMENAVTRTMLEVMHAPRQG